MKQSGFYLFLVLVLTLTGACAAAVKSIKPISQAAPTAEKRAAVYRRQAVEDKLFAATGRLSSRYKTGHYNCTAIVLFREKNTYLFLTAAHCLIVDNKKKPEEWEYTTDLWLRLENLDTKQFEYYPAKSVILGHDFEAAFDFALVEAFIPRDIPAPVLSHAELKVNDCVVSVAYPADGGGADIFYGFVDYVNADIEAFVRLGQIKDSFGASGAALASCREGDILGLIIGQDKEDH